MGILKNLRNVLPLPRSWAGEEHHFGMRVNDAITELLARRVAKIMVNGSEIRTDANDVADLGDMAASVRLTSADNTWAKIFAKISVIPLARPATIYVNSSVISALTGGEITTGAWSGVITRTSSTSDYSLILKSAGNQIRACSISGATSSSSGTWSDLRKADNDAVVHLTGDEIIDGTKTFIGSHLIKNANQSPLISFRGAQNEQTGGLIYCRNCGNSSGDQYYGAPIFSFIEYSPSSDGSARQSNYERYDLPAVNAGRTSNGIFQIHTEKTFRIVTGSAAASTDTTLTVGKDTSAVIVVTGNNTARIALFVIKSNTNSSQTCYVQKIGGGSDVTGANASGNFKITNGATAALNVYCVVFEGSIAFP